MIRNRFCSAAPPPRWTAPLRAPSLARLIYAETKSGASCAQRSKKKKSRASTRFGCNEQSIFSLGLFFFPRSYEVSSIAAFCDLLEWFVQKSEYICELGAMCASALSAVSEAKDAVGLGNRILVAGDKWAIALCEDGRFNWGCWILKLSCRSMFSAVSEACALYRSNVRKYIPNILCSLVCFFILLKTYAFIRNFFRIKLLIRQNYSTIRADY